MRLPEHVTPAIPGRCGQAPYNFVPLPEAIFLPPGEPFQAHDRLDPERLHGCIDLDIITETELYTRCAYPPAEEGKDIQKSPPRQAFYHHGDENRPVIPGSSLRGMIRSLVEILSYSRITRRRAKGEAVRIQDERLVYRAVADQETPTGQAYNERFLERLKPMQFYYPSRQVQAGYLERDPTTAGWRIRPACKVQNSSFIRVHLDTLTKNGFPDYKNHVQDVWVRPEPVQPHSHKRGLTLYYALTREVSNTARSSLVRGVLVYSGPMQTRHMHTVIYEPDMKAAPISIPEKMWEQFCEDRDQQRGIPCRKIGNQGDPLFYLLNNKGQLEFFGPTLFFRLPYPNYTGDYVPQEIIANDGPLDLAETIFGTVNGEDQSYRGRVLFTDAEMISTPDNRSPFLEGQDGIRWPSVLSTPKPTSYQNYLVQTHPEGKRENLLSYSAPSPDIGDKKAETTVLRGLKQYWHRGSASEKLHLEPPTKHHKQYTVIRPVRRGVRFRGQVRFENLAPLELGALLSALELPENYRHHLGMGKPLGMGSVQIRATVTLIDPIRRYRSLAEHGRFDETTQCDILTEAREAFCTAIIDHHNKNTPASLQVTSTARFWDIPRLQTLGYLLDWQNQPPRRKTDYIRDLKAFRSRQILPTPAGVLGQPEPTPITPADRPSVDMASAKSSVTALSKDMIAAIPALELLQVILQDSARSQRERLDAIDEALLRRLAELDGVLRQHALEMIRWAIGVNKKSRHRLQEIQQRLRGEAS